MNLYKVVRRTHLYLALFLAPWMVMFAVSTIAMNHLEFFSSFYEEARPAFIPESETTYPDELTDTTDETAATRILSELALDGRHNVSGSLADESFEVRRHSASAMRKITFDPAKEKLVVQRQEFRTAIFLNRLHSRRGYGHGYVADELWAVHVDAVIVAMLLWSASGLWLWLVIKRTRKTGALCLVVGIGLFLFFLYTI